MNMLKNFKMPAPIDPSDPDAGHHDVDSGLILSHFLAMAKNMADLKDALMYREDRAYSKATKYAPVAGGLVSNPIQTDPVPMGEIWEVQQVTFFFPDSAAASSTSYFARVFANGRFADQVIGAAVAPPNDAGNGVIQLIFPVPHILQPGQSIYADIGAQVANVNAAMNVFYQCVKRPPVSVRRG